MLQSIYDKTNAAYSFFSKLIFMAKLNTLYMSHGPIHVHIHVQWIYIYSSEFLR